MSVMHELNGFASKLESGAIYRYLHFFSTLKFS